MRQGGGRVHGMWLHVTDEAGTWRGALEWRETVRYYYRCASEAAGAYIASMLPTNTTVSYKNILFRTVLIKLHCDDRHQGPMFKFCRRGKF